jgi:hypothetical protein
MRRVQQSWWPLGPASVLAPAATIVVVVLAMTWPMVGWPYPLWVQTSAQFHQQFTWAGLIAGTAACWYATVLHARDRIWVQPRAPRSGASVATRHLTTLVGWFVGAYLAALVPLVASTVFAGGIGSPDMLVMLSGVLAMVAATALGYALGTVVPSAAMVPIVAAGFYALLVAGSAAGESYAAVAPVLYLEPELGQHESLPLVVFRIALFVAVTVAAVGLAGRSLPGRSLPGGPSRPWRTIADVVAYAAIPAALIVISLTRQPVVFTADTPQPASCTERRDIRYCVHHDNRPRLAELVRTVDPLIARFGTKPANLDQVWDQALTLRPIDVDIAHGLEVAWLNPDGTIDTQVATAVAGLYACTTPGTQHTEKDIEKLTQTAADISDFLSTGTPAGTLSGLSGHDVQQWIARHQKQLQTCTLTPDQLPSTQAR